MNLEVLRIKKESRLVVPGKDTPTVRRQNTIGIEIPAVGQQPLFHRIAGIRKNIVKPQAGNGRAVRHVRRL